MSDKCPKCGADLAKRMKYTFVCGTTELTVGGYDDGKECLRRQLAAANAKLAEMARLASDSAKAATELVDLRWRTDDFGDEGIVLLWDGECAVSAELGPGFYDTSKARSFGNPTHWMPLYPPTKEADDDDA